MLFSSCNRHRSPGILKKTMVFAEIQTELPKARYFHGAMDARTVARISGVKLGTLNAWIQRGLIPGMTIGTKGRPRNIDANTALRIAIFAELLRHLAPPDYAARVAATMSETEMQAGWLCIIPGQADRITIAHFSPPEHPSELIRQFEDSEDPPTFFAAVNVGKLAERVRLAEAEWQERGGAKT
jgi:hypothetical protein